MRLTSPAFSNGQAIPRKYGRNFGNISPPLDIHEVPEGTVSLALLVTDPDIPEAGKKRYGIEEWDHWMVYDIPPATLHILEGITPEGKVGLTTRKNARYEGPAPPDREHRYFFDVYALDILLGLGEGATRHEVKQKMSGHILGHAQLMGTFKP
ncbi:MAG: YbhB/YbcL family Raf kinase inhibitor-like protein [archaeon]